MSATDNKVMAHRLGALTDGVFAIVMTILVLDIKAPEDINVYRKVNPDTFLTGHFQDVILFMMVFIALGYLWYIHHGQAYYIQHTDRNHLWINIITLMFVSLIPFSSSLVNEFPEDVLAELFFASNMFLIGLLNYFNWIYATWKSRLVDENISQKVVESEKKKLLIFPMVSLVAIVVAFIYPTVSSYVLLAAPVIVFLKRFVK